MSLVKIVSEMQNLAKKFQFIMKIYTKWNAQGRSNVQFLVVVRDDPLISTHDSKIFVRYGLFRTHFKTVSALFASCMMPPESWSWYNFFTSWVNQFLFSNILHSVTEPKIQLKAYTNQMKLNISFKYKLSRARRKY